MYGKIIPGLTWRPNLKPHLKPLNVAFGGLSGYVKRLDARFRNMSTGFCGHVAQIAKAVREAVR